MMYKMIFGDGCSFEFKGLLDLIMTMNSITWSFRKGETVRFYNLRTGEVLETECSAYPLEDLSRFIQLFADCGWR